MPLYAANTSRFLKQATSPSGCFYDHSCTAKRILPRMGDAGICMFPAMMHTKALDTDLILPSVWIMALKDVQRTCWSGRRMRRRHEAPRDPPTSSPFNSWLEPERSRRNRGFVHTSRSLRLWAWFAGCCTTCDTTIGFSKDLERNR